LPTGAAPKVVLWGTGSPSRELLHVDDLADACLFIMSLDDETFVELIHGDNRDQRSDDLPSPSDFNEADSEGKLSSVKSLPLINIGCGKDLTIRELANLVSRLVGYEGEVLWDTAKPDGTPRKLLDISRLKSLGWSPRIDLETGIRNTYNWYLEQGSQVNFCCGLE
ncbi:MAG: NAD-dependent epimerase/dehydratase family protein, partial [bacterium]